MIYLRQHRCLLILDSWESILSDGKEQQGEPTSVCVGRYRRGYEAYSELLRRVAEERHQSCLLLTSREKQVGLASLEGDTLPVRSLQLEGLGFAEGREILQSTGLSISEVACRHLIERYSGNPLVLKNVAACVRELFSR